MNLKKNLLFSLMLVASFASLQGCEFGACENPCFDRPESLNRALSYACKTLHELKTLRADRQIDRAVYRFAREELNMYIGYAINLYDKPLLALLHTIKLWGYLKYNNVVDDQLYAYIDGIVQSIVAFAKERPDVLDINKAHYFQMTLIYADDATPLQVAAIEGYTHAILILLAGGANPNRRVYEDGLTPLMEAIRLGKTAAAKALLSAKKLDLSLEGYDLENEGGTALDWAHLKGNATLAGLIEKRLYNQD